MKNDLKVVQISEANNGYIVTLVRKDKASELTRECTIYIATTPTNARWLYVKNFWRNQMSETCGICKKERDFTMRIAVEGKKSKPICMECMLDLPEKLKKHKEKANEQMAIGKKS